MFLPTRYLRQSINPVNGEFDDLYINATETGLFLNCCFFRSSLESYTSNNTRQREATRHNTRQHEYNTRQHKYNTRQNEYNTRQHECNTRQHGCNKRQHEYNTTQHEYKTT